MCHNVNTLRNIQTEIAEWSRTNFGIQASKWPGFDFHTAAMKPITQEQFENETIILHHVAPLLGMVEETGELTAAYRQWTSASQKMGGVDCNLPAAKAEIRDAIGDIFIYFLDYCARTGPQSHAMGGSITVPTEIQIFNCVEWDYMKQQSPDFSAFHCEMLTIHLGKIIHCNLKRHQGIRKMGDNTVFLPTIGMALTRYFQTIRDLYRATHTRTETDDATGRPVERLMSYQEAFDGIVTIAASTWKHVRERNWVKSPNQVPVTPLNSSV